MKIAITIDLDLDTTGWGDEYGMYGAEAKSDAARYILTLIQQCAAGRDELWSDVTVRRVVERRVMTDFEWTNPTCARDD